MVFDGPALLEQLRRLPSVRRFAVAFSGGRDSRVLLHALASLDPLPGGVPLSAIHVDHTIHPHSARWSAHCETVCGELGIPCETIRVDGRARPGESPEAAARERRYAALRGAVEEGTCLLTAHHQDDQAETFLIQLLRGGGPRGLAAMPRLAPFGGGWLARPLLPFPRDALAAYAELHRLRWVDDPSNFTTDFDRNYLRQRLVPPLIERWPGAAKTLARAAGHNADAAGLLAQLAEIDLAALVGSRRDTLSVSGLLGLGASRSRNALIHWFRRLGLAAPGSRHLERLCADVLGAAADAQPLLRWRDVEVRRYHDDLHARRQMPEIRLPAQLPWPDLSAPLVLPDGRRLLTRRAGSGGLRPGALAGRRITIRFRRGGERCLPREGAGHRPLKKLLQEGGVPPWERGGVPLLYVDEELAAVVGLFSCVPFAGGGGEPSIQIVEEKPDFPGEFSW